MSIMWIAQTVIKTVFLKIHGYYKRNRHFQPYVVSKPLA